MSLALLTSRIPDASPRRRPGRPVVAEIQSERDRHLQCATLYLAGHKADRVAKLLDISARTVTLWTRRALGYSTPEAEVLRRQFGPRVESFLRRSRPRIS